MFEWLTRLFRPARGRQYPPSHDLAMERVLLTVNHLRSDPEIDDEILANALQNQGVPRVDAELLVLFVPIAFTWAILKKMGVSSFPSTYLVANCNDQTVELPISREHYFSTALHLAHHTTEYGYTDAVTRDGFEAIIARSAEMNAANKALREGADIAGSTVGPPYILSVTAEAIAESRAAT